MLNTFAKRSILDVGQGSEYASGRCLLYESLFLNWSGEITLGRGYQKEIETLLLMILR